LEHDNDNELPRTRAEAKEKGLKRYYTGEPCKNGHVASRITSNQICVTCDLEWRAENREALLSGKRERYRANRDRELAYARRYRAKNRDKVLAASRRWKENNPEKLKEDWANWYAINGKERDARVRSTPRGKIDGAMSRGIYGAIKDKKAGRKWESLVGYTVDQLMASLKKKFLPGMTFDNYGFYGWHIDHKIPKSVFNYTSPEHSDFKKCWALKNLQPLWGPDNLRKWAKLETPFQPSLAIH
jgi:hypothetical protein